MITLQAKSYLSNDPALVVLYKQIREKTLQTLKGATQIPPTAEWNFVLRNARLYDRMGCDLLALDLVRHWEFLRSLPPPSASLIIPTALDPDNAVTDYRKLLRRRSSLVIADLPVRSASELLSSSSSKDDNIKSPTTAAAKPKPQPTTFEEPDANSLLDSFGF
jgi:hypothetical protein